MSEEQYGDGVRGQIVDVVHFADKVTENSPETHQKSRNVVDYFLALPVLKQNENQMHARVPQSQNVQRRAVVRIVIEHEMAEKFHQSYIRVQIGHEALFLVGHHLKQREKRGFLLVANEQKSVYFVGSARKLQEEQRHTKAEACRHVTARSPKR